MKKKNNLTKIELLNTSKVTISNAISKFGDVLFDYVNTVFLSSISNGGLWVSFYQSSEVIISVFFNFWGELFQIIMTEKKLFFIVT